MSPSNAAAQELNWTHCPPQPLAWIQWRELALAVVHTPWLLLPLLALMVVLLLRPLPLGWLQRGVVLAVVVMSASLLYSPLATGLLSHWLDQQVPQASIGLGPSAVVVIPGRGPQIAAATTQRAAQLLAEHKASLVLVTGDTTSTAKLLVRQGVRPDQLVGESCARTTWENATTSAAWLQQHRPGVPIALVTDRWQLARAARAFAAQGLQVVPIAADAFLSPQQQNQLAIREALAITLYRLQNRT